MIAGKDYIGVGVGAVITKNDKVLLLLRKKAPEAGCWTIAGGKVEFGEKIEDAILREVKEEVGVSGNIIALLGITNHILAAEKMHYVSPRFLIEIDGEPQNVEPDSHDDMQWFSINDLPDNLTITAQEAIEAYFNYKKSLLD